MAALPLACGEKKSITSSSKKVSPVVPKPWACADRQTERHETCPHRFSKSLAEWRCRALGGECASGVARLCHRSEPATSEKIAERIPPLLSRRPDSSRAGEGHARWPRSGNDADGPQQDCL